MCDLCIFCSEGTKQLHLNIDVSTRIKHVSEKAVRLNCDWVPKDKAKISKGWTLKEVQRRLGWPRK